MKTNIILVAVLLVLLVIFGFFTSSSSDQSTFFQDEIIRVGVERVGQPIEGFSAPIFLQAFPGLIEKDFDGVQTIEGVYSFKDTGLVYTRTADQPITSAEEMISKEGYKTFLTNLSTRFNLEVSKDTEVSILIEKIQKDDSPTGILPFDSGVSGQVLRGPICPVMREGDDSCADQPYATTVQVVEANTSKNSLFAESDTDKDGNYKFTLPPGEYSIQAIGGNPFPSCGSTDIIIEPSVVLELDLSCDTGIR